MGKAALFIDGGYFDKVLQYGGGLCEVGCVYCHVAMQQTTRFAFFSSSCPFHVEECPGVVTEFCAKANSLKWEHMGHEKYERSTEGGITTSNGEDIPDSEIRERIRIMEEENARMARRRPWYMKLWSWKE